MAATPWAGLAPEPSRLFAKMPRYDRYDRRDSEPAQAGDVAFIGVNAKLAPELLQPGYCAAALNKRFRAGAADDRGGLTTPVAHRHPAGVTFGGGLWSDPDGLEWILQATANGMTQTRDGHSRRLIGVPEAITARVTIVQAFGSVLLFRGSSLPPWQWNGSDDAFIPVPQTVTGDNTTPIPNGSDRPGLEPVLLNNRLFVPVDRSRIAASDLLVFTRYDASRTEFNVNTGSDDAITGLFPLTQRTLLVFKDQSICAIDNIAGTLDQVRLDVINPEIGCIAGGSAAQVGGDVLFLSAAGVFRLQQVIQSRLQTAAVPVSDAITPIIRRIHMRHAAGAVAAVQDEYYFLAVPLDGSTVNNAILPFNTTTDAWEGIHTFPAGVQIDRLLKTDHLGVKRLFAVDYANGRVHLLYEGRADRVGETETAITSRLETRAYGLGSPVFKRFRRAVLTLRTLGASLTVETILDGVNERAPVAELTPSRTRSYLHAVPDYALSNAGDDHGAPGREDYAVTMATPFALKSGIALDLAQTSSERFGIRERGRVCSIGIVNTAGFSSVAGLQIEGDETDRHTRTAA